ncbi:cupredoxin domain-containing protein [Uliginosibacterium gangwonense]|uniref:cupredoxin domain-containing protein n=1 Tax=Uliginosibacterium gangwonense TaxID=392736 RepID=UPI00036A9AD4|nr:cupredoxin family protein [Uliginosibacterium gangwonense]
MNVKTFAFSFLLSCGVVLGTTDSAIANGDHARGHKDDGMNEHAHMSQNIGRPGKATSHTRVVKIDMTDNMRFSPADIKVKAGETVRFVVTNTGKIRHEMVIGAAAELKEHSELMKKFPRMEHSEPNMVTVAPGGSSEIVWTFARAGRVDFACLQPGHFDAGMRGVVAVNK